LRLQWSIYTILLYSSSIVTLEENGRKGQYWKVKKPPLIGVAFRFRSEAYEIETIPEIRKACPLNSDTHYSAVR